MKKLTTLICFPLFVWSLSAESGELQWYKGNTHTHTLWSDGNDFPETAADWYKRHGYHFLVLSDHNILSRGEKWKDVTKQIRKHNLIQKHLARWGADSLELNTEEGRTLVKLKTLDEVRALVEEPGRFIMIEGMELTSAAGRAQDKKLLLPVHSNVVNVDEPLIPMRTPTVEELIRQQEKLVTNYMERVNHPVFWHLNHPNFKYSNTAEQVAGAKAVHGLEIFNASSGCRNLGDDRRPSIERMWDIANAIRLVEYGLPPLYGCGSDDTHNYHTPEGHYHSGRELKDAPGLAWVMVRAAALTPDAITEALRDGDFYASTGITFKEYRYDSQSRQISLLVDAQPGVNYTVQFVGVPRDVSLDHKTPDPVVDERGVSHPVTGSYEDVRLGTVIKAVAGISASYQLTGNELFVRAVVSCDDPELATIDSGPIAKKAWTQPVGWEKFLEDRP